jgi:hypothetical protein
MGVIGAIGTYAGASKWAPERVRVAGHYLKPPARWVSRGATGTAVIGLVGLLVLGRELAGKRVA